MSPERAAPAVAAALLLFAVAPPQARAADPTLESALRSIAQAGPLSTARLGVLVADAATGEVLLGKDADVLLNPASNVKLVTTAAALARLGPGFRFDTEFLVDPAQAGSPSPRALYVRGKGDPTLVTERLWAIAGELAHAGIKRIGDVVLDDGYFDAERVGPGFDQEDGDRSYLAPAGALSFNWNTVAIYVAPGERRGARARVELEPASDLFAVEVRAVTGAPRGARRVKVSSSFTGGRQRIVVEGQVPAGSRTQVVWRRIDEPALYLGHSLARLLELRGVKVTGRIRTGQAPAGARLVHVASSDTLAEVVRRLNKTSNNFVAEQLLKTLGAEVKGAPGSWPKGVAAVEEFLAEAGVPRGGYVMKNGSGLNDANRFSARQLVTVLRAMYARFPLAAEYVASLPVAGRDGTLRFRLDGTEAADRLRAKTGTLENVTSLSGYVQTAGGRTLAFAVLANDFSGRASGAARGVDAIAGALAASGGGAAAIDAAVALARPPSATASPAATTADLASAARTYYALARAGDARNVAFLRSALRAETDPALRLAVGEAAYLSEPDGDTARRLFLEALSPDAACIGRLWAALAGDDPPPVVRSIGELAAEGGGEALARLVELSQAAALEPRLADGLADALATAAAGAPEELVTALRAASPGAREAATVALGRGLGRSEEQDHPFPPALARLSGGDGEAAAFARDLAARLETVRRAAEERREAPSLEPAASVPR
ncbi:MAG: D-alanyl-D-alanine carboxypeptidase/D-alanyl-D-alanine-endopeptidase [Anaeromyxobacter sp.]